MVTPSLVMVGAPNFLSRTTLRPRGPRVTLTVSASLSTPRSRERRASSLNLMILAMGRPLEIGGGTTTAPGDRKSTRLNSSHANIPYAVFCLPKQPPPHPDL